jgi:asparagine synthase (glutamine-hydrolysing)
MCGIWGVVGPVADRVGLDRESEIQERIRHRGPDGEGIFRDSGVLIGHRRLAIIDPGARSDQPLQSQSGRYTISFNGEIYNFPQLRARLGRAPDECPSDTHVILAAWEAMGRRCLPLLNGMFAFALWDAAERTLVLARDRLGIKPLFVRRTADGVAFGSEIGSIMQALPDSATTYDLQALSEFLAYGNPLGDRTFYRDVRALTPGTLLTVTPSQYASDTYADGRLREANGRGDKDAAPEQLLSILGDAVDRHLISDRPIGVFLSGGLDSTTIACLAAERGHAVRTITARFDGRPTADSEQARATAMAIGAEHTELDIRSVDAASSIDRLSPQHGQPFGDAATIPLLAMSEAASENFAVVLQGDGGDEVFGGYRRYRHLRIADALGGQQMLARTGPALQAISRRAPSRPARYLAAFAEADSGRRMAKLLTQVQDVHQAHALLTGPMARALSRCDPEVAYSLVGTEVHEDLTSKMLAVDRRILLPNTFLEKVDRATMAASIEARVPLLDNEVVDLVTSWPSSWNVGFRSGKLVLRRAVKSLVPPNVLAGPKMGFGTPVRAWMNGELHDVLADRVRSDKARDVLDPAAIEQAQDALRMGRAAFGTEVLLYRALALATWLEWTPRGRWLADG